MLERKSLLSNETQYAILVGVILPTQKEQDILMNLQELEVLAQTAGVVTIKRLYQRLQKPHPKTFIGSGKLEEIRNYIEQRPEIKMVIFDDDLSGSQFSVIEETLKVRIIDRSMLILDIFAMHAQTARAKTQVEIAQYKYILPRLRGMWKHLERQGGGVGTRGPGETELETDRRIVQQKISLLSQKLEKIERQGNTQRQHRLGLAQVALCGYTNAGKTAIMNSFSKERLTSENKLFVTLDTTTRKISMPDFSFLLSDTVGFIQKTPHHLIESFKTTLQEVCQAHYLLHVVDISHAQCKTHFKVVEETLQSIGAKDIPTIIVLNKVDLLLQQSNSILLNEEDKNILKDELVAEWKTLTQKECFLVSALEQINMDSLQQRILELVKPTKD